MEAGAFHAPDRGRNQFLRRRTSCRERTSHAPQTATAAPAIRAVSSREGGAAPTPATGAVSRAPRTYASRASSVGSGRAGAGFAGAAGLGAPGAGAAGAGSIGAGTAGTTGTGISIGSSGSPAPGIGAGSRQKRS